MTSETLALSIETEVQPITEDWLKEVGFKWHQLSRQPEKQWLLWLGDATRGRDSWTSYEDIGVELSSGGSEGSWFCWLRSDLSMRYSRFIHLRHVKTQQELISMIEGITGQQWDPTNNLYGSMRKPEHAQRIRQDNERLDRKIRLERPWRDCEKDGSQGGALPEHLDGYVKAGLEKRRDL